MRTALILLLALGAEQSATQFLRDRAEEIRAALPPKGTTPTPEGQKRIEEIVTRAIDTRTMLESVLGPRMKTMSESQRRRLLAAFQNRFRKASGVDFEAYRTSEITYEPEVRFDHEVKVPTRVTVSGEPTQIAYTLRMERGAYHIVDLTIDGVSTVENYRSSFNRVIAKDGVEALIKRLEHKPLNEKD